MIAFGSMGAGGIGASLTYQKSANFVFNAIGGGIFLIDPLSNFSLGSGFDSALFQIILNGNIFESQSFGNLASAQAFFSPSNLINISLAAGLNNIQLAFNETMSGGEGFGFNYGAAGISAAGCLCRTLTAQLDDDADGPRRIRLDCLSSAEEGRCRYRSPPDRLIGF